MSQQRFALRWIHKAAQQKHFRERVKERFGLDLDIPEWSDVLVAILTNRAEMLARPSLRTSMWRVTLFGTPVVVVFDHETLEMVTIITEEMWAERSLAKGSPLTSTLAETPAGKVLQQLKENK